MSKTGLLVASVAALLVAMSGGAALFACSYHNDDDDDCMGFEEKCDDDDSDAGGYDDWCLKAEDCGPLVSEFSEMCPNTMSYEEMYLLVCVENSNPTCLADCRDEYAVCAAVWECYTTNDCAGYSGDDDCK